MVAASTTVARPPVSAAVPTTVLPSSTRTVPVGVPPAPLTRTVTLAEVPYTVTVGEISAAVAVAANVTPTLGNTAVLRISTLPALSTDR